MTGIGELIEELASSGRVDEVDANIVFTLARFHRTKGFLTLPQEAVAWLLLRDYGVDVSSIARPVDDDADTVERRVSENLAVPTGLPQPKLKRKSAVRFYITTDTDPRHSGEEVIAGETPFELKDLCKAVPGRRWSDRKKGGLGKWVWSVGPIAATALAEAFKSYDPDWDEGFAKLLGHLDAAAEHKLATDLPDIESVKTTAWMHQRQAYYFVKELSAAALFMDMGTGKSLVAVARAMDVGGDILVVCPDKVVGVWPREFRRHANTDVHIENGTRPKRGGGHKKLKVTERTAAFEELRNCTCGRPHVYVTNYEATIHEPLSTFLKNRSWDLVIYDESHRLKSPTGSISKLAAQVSKKADRRLALTGTPFPHSPLDAFGQFRALDSGIFGNSFTQMKHRYAIMGGYEGKEVIGINPLMLDELHARCFQIAFQVRSEDVLDLPGVLPEQWLTCNMDGPQARAYNDMAKELTAEFPGKTISEIAEAAVRGETIASNALVKLLRCRQITGGALKDDETNQILQLGTAKEKLLADWMEDVPIDEPIVVFGEFTYDIDVIRRVAATGAGKKGWVPRTIGEVSGRRSDLNEDGEYPEGVQVLAVQIASGGTGVDLTRACYAAFYSTGYNNGNYRQARKRLDRPGQTRPVRFTHLHCEDTIDQDIFEVLEGRQETSESVQYR